MEFPLCLRTNKYVLLSSSQFIILSYYNALSSSQNETIDHDFKKRCNDQGEAKKKFHVIGQNETVCKMVKE